MTLTLLPIPERKRVKCDTAAYLAAKAETHRKLKHEIDEQRISAILVDKHNRHIREANQFRQTGDRA